MAFKGADSNPTPRLKARTVNTLSHLKKSLAGGGDGFIRGLRDGDAVTVRFLHEIVGDEGVVEYYEHYDSGQKAFFPCAENCPGCRDGDKPSKRFLCAVIDVDKDPPSLAIFKLTAKMMEQLQFHYERNNGTITDRNYELSRRGSGMQDTSYYAIADRPSRLRDVRRFSPKPHSSWAGYLWALLENQLPGNQVTLAESPNGSRSSSSKTQKPRQKSYYDEEEEDDDPPPKFVVKGATKKTTTRTTRGVPPRRGKTTRNRRTR